MTRKRRLEREIQEFATDTVGEASSRFMPVIDVEFLKDAATSGTGAVDRTERACLERQRTVIEKERSEIEKEKSEIKEERSEIEKEKSEIKEERAAMEKERWAMEKGKAAMEVKIFEATLGSENLKRCRRLCDVMRLNARRVGGPRTPSTSRASGLNGGDAVNAPAAMYVPAVERSRWKPNLKRRSRK